MNGSIDDASAQREAFAAFTIASTFSFVMSLCIARKRALVIEEAVAGLVDDPTAMSLPFNSRHSHAEHPVTSRVLLHVSAPPAKTIDLEVLPPERAAAVSQHPWDRWLGVIAYVMDNLFRMPGTQRRFGLDPLIGLIPGIGDGANGALGAMTMVRAAQRGVPKTVMARMALNILLDSGVGAIPVVGDAFSFWFKSFARNYALLEKHSGEVPTAPTVADKVFVWSFVALAVALPLAAIVLLASLWVQVLRFVFG